MAEKKNQNQSESREDSLEKNIDLMRDEIAMMKTKKILEKNGEFNYYLLDQMTMLNETLKKIGLALVNIGQTLEEKK